MDPVLLIVSLASAFCFSLGLVLAQFGLRSVAPLAGACVSIPTTAAIFLLLSPLTVGFAAGGPAGWSWTGWSWTGAGIFASAGLVYPVAVTLLTFWSSTRIGPHLTGALGNLAPLFAIGFAVPLLGEVPRAGQLLGVGAICAGVGALFLGRGAIRLPGRAWLLAAPLAGAALRGVAQPWVGVGLEVWPDPFAAATIGYLISATTALLAGAASGALGEARREAARDWPWFVAVGVSNGAAVLLLYMALGMGPVTVVTPLVACHPLFTLALNRLLRGERGLPPRVLLGVAATVAGVALLLAG